MSSLENEFETGLILEILLTFEIILRLHYYHEFNYMDEFHLNKMFLILESFAENEN